MARTVRMLGVPVDLYLEASRHMSEIAREFTLISVGERTGVTAPVPRRLLELVSDLSGRYRGTADAIRARVTDAAASGGETVDIEFSCDETGVKLTDDITELLDAADEFCRSGDLLTLASSPEVVAWRHWWRDQVIDQIRNDAEPTPFTS